MLFLTVYHTFFNLSAKLVLNYLRTHKKETGIKKPFSRWMFTRLLDCNEILKIFSRAA
jgi:hypothetical protein